MKMMCHTSPPEFVCAIEVSDTLIRDDILLDGSFFELLQTSWLFNSWFEKWIFLFPHKGTSLIFGRGGLWTVEKFTLWD